MKIKMTNEKVFELAFILKTKYPDLEKFDKRFNFAVTRTLSNIQPIAADLLKARESSIFKFKEFEQKKELIIKSYAELDDQGKVKQDKNGRNIFKSENDRLNGQKEMDILANEYKDAIQERQKEINIYNEILSQEVEVDIIQCKWEALPNEFNFDILRPLVKETDQELEALL